MRTLPPTTMQAAIRIVERSNAFLNQTPFEDWGRTETTAFLAALTAIGAQEDGSIIDRMQHLITEDETLLLMLVDLCLCGGYALALADAAERTS